MAGRPGPFLDLSISKIALLRQTVGCKQFCKHTRQRACENVVVNHVISRRPIVPVLKLAYQWPKLYAAGFVDTDESSVRFTKKIKKHFV